MTWLRRVLVAYGIVNVLGGVIGLVMAKSALSLVAGAVAGALLIWFGLIAGTKPAMAFRTAGFVCLALGAFWIYRTLEVVSQNKSPMMAVGNLALAALVFGMLTGAHFAALERRSSSPA